MPVALVVDDEAAVRNGLDEFLRLQGYAVRTAADGTEALAQLQIASPDVIILDHQMPRMSGLALLRHLRASAPEIAVILVTALLNPETHRLAQQLGVRACLQKPIRLSDLKRCLREVQIQPKLATSLAHSLVQRGLALLLRREIPGKPSMVTGPWKRRASLARTPS